MVQKKGDTFSKSRMQIDGTRGTRRRVREKGPMRFRAPVEKMPRLRDLHAKGYLNRNAAASRWKKKCAHLDKNHGLPTPCQSTKAHAQMPKKRSLEEKAGQEER